MSDRSNLDGLRAFGGRPRVKGTDQHRLRVTATVMLGKPEDRVEENREAVLAAMVMVRETLAARGLMIEFVVGHPRSPEDLMASLEALANGHEDLAMVS